MNKNTAILALVMLVVCLAPVQARAGCPSASGCTMARALTADLSPPEPCIILRISSDNCDCEAWVSLENNCAVNFSAIDFSFGECMIDGVVTRQDCPTIIPPGSWGSVFYPIDPDLELGTHLETRHLNVSGKDINLLVTYDLEEYRTGCSCGGHGRRGSMTWVLVAGFFVLLCRSRKTG
jgi:hypothetical protein